MSAAAAPHDLLLPQPPGGMLRGGALALAAHAVMLAALTTVMQWRADAPDAVTAELWAPLPQPAVPAPPPAPRATMPVPPSPPEPAKPQAEPTLPDPQIALARERAERERAAQERAEKQRRELAEQRERKEREAEAKRREQAERERKLAAEEKRLAEMREKNLERMMGQAGSAATGSAAQESGPSKSYAGKLVATIKPNIVFTETIRGNPAAEVEVRAGPSGTIIARRLVRSSGHKEWDEAVLRAIDRTGTLPRDTDGRVPPTIIVAFRPQE